MHCCIFVTMEEDHFTRITLRIPKDLLAQIAREAFATAKSQNAEIVGRLKESFASNGASLPQLVKDAVEAEQEARGGTPEEALTRLVLAGQANGGTVFQLTLQPGVKLQEISAVMEAARMVIPPNADVFVERK